MNVHDTLPREVREIENLWIPMADGCRLAARLWLPEGAEGAPVPAILEYLPYRKRDFTRRRDEGMHRWFAGHGYVAVRVDMRGSGESDGLMHDEYLRREQDDALEVIDWIARQPWCSGRVGMMGKSWGAYNSLQVAARTTGGTKSDHRGDGYGRSFRGMTFTIPAAACSTTIFGGAASCRCSMRARRTPKLSVIAGGRCGSSGWRPNGSGRTSGSLIRHSTNTGSTARCASTIQP